MEHNRYYGEGEREGEGQAELSRLFDELVMPNKFSQFNLDRIDEIFDGKLISEKNIEAIIDHEFSN